jgi:hypothetical protein
MTNSGAIDKLLFPVISGMRGNGLVYEEKLMSQKSLQQFDHPFGGYDAR